jgi:hypothetical protein
VQDLDKVGLNGRVKGKFINMSNEWDVCLLIRSNQGRAMEFFPEIIQKKGHRAPVGVREPGILLVKIFSGVRRYSASHG